MRIHDRDGIAQKRVALMHCKCSLRKPVSGRKLKSAFLRTTEVSSGYIHPQCIISRTCRVIDLRESYSKLM